MSAPVRISRVFGGLGFAIAAAVLGASCADPVHDQLVTSLGPENPAVPQGEFHRAGQPCGVCHGPEGPAKTQFTLAGTVFWQGGTGKYTGNVVGANLALVSAVDSLGAQSGKIQTNCVGNFFIRSSDFAPAFPILVSVFAPSGSGTSNAVMFTQISRSTSCATCHSDPVNYNSPGHVFLTQNDLSTAAAQMVKDNNTNCAADPNLANSPSGGLGP